jgi:hypothetical protein
MELLRNIASNPGCILQVSSKQEGQVIYKPIMQTLSHATGDTLN